MTGSSDKQLLASPLVGCDAANVPFVVSPTYPQYSTFSAIDRGFRLLKMARISVSSLTLYANPLAGKKTASTVSQYSPKAFFTVSSCLRSPQY